METGAYYTYFRYMVGDICSRGIAFCRFKTLMREGWALAENAVKNYHHPARMPEPILVWRKHCTYVTEKRVE